MHCASGDLNPVYWSFIVSFIDRFYVEVELSFIQYLNVTTVSHH